MFKRFFIFGMILFLGACAGRQVKQAPVVMQETARVNFFTSGHTQAAFKVVGQLNEDYLEGVLRVKKIGESDFDVLVMTGAAYRVLHALVSPEGVVYRFLFKEVDNAVVRGRISQFLTLLLSAPGDFKGRRIKDDMLTLTYQGTEGKTRFFYKPQERYPFRAQSVTLLNTADLFYSEYTPVDAEGAVSIPHALVYKDGNITLDMHLISLR